MSIKNYCPLIPELSENEVRSIFTKGINGMKPIYLIYSPLTAPKNLGGHGQSWLEILSITKQIARADSSLAHLFGYHFLCLATVDLYGNKEQFEYYQ